jgi:hypothetical protein
LTLRVDVPRILASHSIIQVVIEFQRELGQPSRAATTRRIAISTWQVIFSPVPSESWENVGDHRLQALDTLGVLHGAEYGRFFGRNPQKRV